MHIPNANYFVFFVNLEVQAATCQHCHLLKGNLGNAEQPLQN